MSEEAIADSNEVSESVDSVEVETVETTEVVEQTNTERMADALAEDLFGKKEPEESEYEEVEEIEEEVEEVAEEVEEPVEARKAPQSWKKDMGDSFAALTPDMQDYIELRETQMKDGLELNKDDSNLGRTMRDAMQPFKPMLDHIEQQRGTTAPQVMQFMLNAHQKLSSGTQETRQAAFEQMAREYGVNMGKPVEGETVDPAMQNMQNELNSMKQHISNTQSQAHEAEVAKVNQDITAFAENEAHPYFEEVSEQIVAFIKAGDDLEGAYEKAVWANPVTRQKEMERIQQDTATKASANAKQDVTKAKKASATNIKGRNTKRTPTAPTGTINDTLAETLKEIKSRN